MPWRRLGREVDGSGLAATAIPRLDFEPVRGPHQRVALHDKDPLFSHLIGETVGSGQEAVDVTTSHLPEVGQAVRQCGCLFPCETGIELDVRTAVAGRLITGGQKCSQNQGYRDGKGGKQRAGVSDYHV